MDGDVDVLNGIVKQPEGKIESALKSCKFMRCFLGSDKVVSVIRLNGIISAKAGMRNSISLESMQDHIERAFKYKNLVAVCLLINSPGGSPVQSELIASRIMTLAKEKNIEVYSFIEDVGASGGYWLACAGDEIYASKSSVVGSIGVTTTGFGFDKAINKIGVDRRIYTEGTSKSVLDPFMPEKKADVEIIKKLQRSIHEHFMEYVKSRRKSRLTQNDTVLFNGEFWCGQTALDFGLIDGIGDLYTFIADKYGKDVSIKHTPRKVSWFKRSIFGSQISADDIVESVLNKLDAEAKTSRFDMW